MITLEVKRDRPKGTGKKGPAKRDQDPKGPQIKLTTFYLRNKKIKIYLHKVFNFDSIDLCRSTIRVRHAPMSRVDPEKKRKN